MFYILQIIFSLLSVFSMLLYVFTIYRKVKINLEIEKMNKESLVFFAMSTALLVVSSIFYYKLTRISMIILLITFFILVALRGSAEIWETYMKYPYMLMKKLKIKLVRLVIIILGGTLLICTPCEIVNAPKDISEYTIDTVSETQKISLAEENKVISASYYFHDVTSSKKVTALYIYNSTKENSKSKITFLSYDQQYAQGLTKHNLEDSEFNLNIIPEESEESPYYIKRTTYYSFVSKNDPMYKRRRSVVVFDLYIKESEIERIDISTIH